MEERDIRVPPLPPGARFADAYEARLILASASSPALRGHHICSRQELGPEHQARQLVMQLCTLSLILGTGSGVTHKGEGSFSGSYFTEIS